MYGHETLTLEEVYEALRLKETMKQLVNGFEAKAEGLKKKVLGIVKEADRSSKLETSLISIARKKGMLLMIVISYITRIRQLQIREEQPMTSGQVSVAEEDHSDGELVDVSDGNSKPFEEWVLCMFHMCPNRDWFSTMKLCQVVQA